MICPECDRNKIVFVSHPCDEKQEIKICTDCAIAIEYELGEKQSGLATMREEALCL